MISNGVINLSPDKQKVFDEADRLLKPGGRFAISDIVTETQLPKGIVCNADLWLRAWQSRAEGFLQRDGRGRRHACENDGDNTAYAAISENAQGRAARYGSRAFRSSL